MAEGDSYDRQRDRGRTEDAIVAAARAVLVDHGFGGWGVNAIARAAECDKQLIYRYFGGLDGLADTLGTLVAAELEAALSARRCPSRTYAGLVATLLDSFLEVLRANPVMQRIIAWELSSESPLTVRFSQARARALSEWIARERGELAPPAGIDAPAVNAMLIAAVQHLVISGASSGNFAGVPLRDDSDWGRVRATIRLAVKAVYGESADDT